MKNNGKKIISTKQFCFFGGIAISLLSVILIMNTGIPARVLGFVPYYLFGIGAMPIFILLYLYGVVMIFRGKPIKIKLNYWLGLFFTIFGTLILISVIQNKGDTSLSNYNNLFFNLDGSGDNFITIKNFAIFGDGYNIAVGSGEDASTITYKFGGGLIGNAVGGVLVNSNNQFGAYLVSVVSIVVGVAMLSFDPIKALIVRFSNREKVAKPKKEKPVKVVNNEKIPAKVEENKEIPQSRMARITNIDPVKNAGELYVKREEVKATTIAPQEAAPAPVNQNNEARIVPQITNLTQQAFPMNGGFVRAKFVRNPQNQQYFETPAPLITPVAPMKEEVKEVPQEVSPNLGRVEQINLFAEEPTAPIDNIQVMSNVEVEKPAKVEFHSNVITPKPVVKKAPKWISPSSDLLEVPETKEAEEANAKVANERIEIINDFFKDFNIGAYVDGYTIGPSVTRFHVQYNHNVSSRTLLNAMSDISLRLGGVFARFEQVVQGKPYSGIEVENVKKTMVSFKDVYEALPDVKKHPLAIAFGKNVQGDVVCADFNDFPHALLAGTTGSGKSVFINSIITTLIMRNSPSDVKLVLIDPKRIELSKYRDIPHLLCPVINEPQQAKLVMSKLVDEMNDRYVMFETADGATSLKEYNEYAAAHGLEKLPYIVAIVDEFGDLVAATNKEIFSPIVLIGQKARACGIHMLIATQRPSVDIITGVIKANLPTHIALCTASPVESTCILGEGGAETLLGHGDMLVQSPVVSRSSLVRLQGCFIQKQEISRVTGYLKEHYETVYNEKFMNLEEVSKNDAVEAIGAGSIANSMDAAEENKYQAVKEWVMCQQYMSMSRIQGDCQVGFNRARRFFNRLQQEGVVGTEVEGNKGCRVLIHDPHTEINDDVVTSDEQSTVS